jgi:uncharacterized protein (TIGR03435 family)
MLAASGFLILSPVKAQSPAATAFEVASVKPHIIPQGFIRRPWSAGIQCPPFNCGISGNRFGEEVASLADLIMDAYAARRYQISGLPSWGDSGRDVYDVTARVEGGTATLAQVRRMLQTLLADRFQLKIHHETKELPVYALVIAKNGPKLTPAQKPCLAPPIPGGGGATKGGGGPAGGGGGDPMGEFIRSWERVPEMLSMMTDRPVIDKTGFEGAYCTSDGQDPLLAVMMQVAPAGGRGGRGASPDRAAIPDADSGGSSVFTVVQEKWGLKLEPQKGPVDILVIDHVERPTEN